MYDRLLPTGPLLVERADHDIGYAAVKRWHYSRSMPSADIDVFGVWEHERFIGAVVFGIGATPQIASPYGLEQSTMRELCRVALDVHVAPVSTIVTQAMRLLHADLPDVELLVSFADENRGHVGRIYQAMNWIYLGMASDSYCVIHGQRVHPRTVVSKFGSRSLGWLREHVDPNASMVPMPPKHRYVWPYSRRLRRALSRRAMPYPKSCGSGVSGDMPSSQDGDAGFDPQEPLELIVPIEWSTLEPITAVEQEALF